MNSTPPTRADSRGTATLIGLGTATPAATCGARQSTALAIRAGSLNPEQQRLAERLALHSGVERRGSVMLTHTTPDDHDLAQEFFPLGTQAPGGGPTTADRMNAYARLAPDLALRSARAALADAHITEPQRITHLITVSCTGFGAPGVDADLILGLALSPDVQRLNIAYMGCHGAINGLRAAAAIARSEPASLILLVCVELCSLHLQYTARPDRIVANTLFADGAAAAVICGLDRAPATGLHILSTGSRILRASREAMRWDIGDHGFAMTLAKSVPDLIQQHVGAFVTDFLASAGWSLDDARRNAAWAVHPGGPRILEAAHAGLELAPGALDASRRVLRDHGNMSSPTVLFILSRLHAARRGRPIVLLAFGPGLAAEAALLHEIGHE